MKETKNDINIKEKIKKIVGKSKLLKKSYVDKNLVNKYYTGNPLLDIFTAGGIPENRLSILYGKKGTFKSSISIPILSSIYQQVSENSIFLLIDTENAFDYIRWKLLGFPVDADNFIVVSPDFGEEIPSIIKEFKKDLPDANIYVIWDSIVATPSKEEVENDQDKIGVLARMLSRLFRVIDLRNDKITMLAINQFREAMMMFSATEQPGGNAVQHKPDFIARLTTSNNEIISKELGKTIKITVDKSRLTAPFRQLELVALYTTGVDTLITTIYYALKHGIIDKTRKPRGGEDTLYFQVPYSEELKTFKQLQYDLLINPDAFILWEGAMRAVANLYSDDEIAYEIIMTKFDNVIDYYFKKENDNRILDLDKLTMVNYIRKLEIIDKEKAKEYKKAILEIVKNGGKK